MEQLSARFFTSAEEVGATTWQRFFNADDDPFSCFEFIQALEQSHSVGAKAGWQPYHLGIYQGDSMIALCLGYLKGHSYGEYVFDWSIAEAYEQHGFDYYPKWLCAVPFTPVTGNRIAILPEVSQQYTLQAIKAALDHHAEQHRWSGWHINFCDAASADALQALPCLRRKTVQFQWKNYNYRHFDDFCMQLKARKRKNIFKERKAVVEAGLQIQISEAEDISLEQMQSFCQFYQRTYLKRSGHLGYLTPAFFEHLWQQMRPHLVLIFAAKAHSGDVVAASLYIRDNDTLYGRYWGCSEHFENLHFELCYYQGIEYCINNKLACFNGGAQGEHKIARGFMPTFTHSCHRFIQSPFADALEDFCARENAQHDLYIQECEHLSAYKVQ